MRRAASGKDWARLSVGVGEGEEAELGLGRVFEAKAGRLQGSRKVRAAEVRGVVEREHPGQGSCPQVKVEGRRLGRIPEQTDGHSRGSPPVGVRVEAPTARGRNKQNERRGPRDTGGTLAGKKRQLSTIEDNGQADVSLCVGCCCSSRLVELVRLLIRWSQVRLLHGPPVKSEACVGFSSALVDFQWNGA